LLRSQLVQPLVRFQELAGENRVEPNRGRKILGHLRLPALDHLPKREGRQLGREDPSRQAFPTTTGNENARRAGDQQPNRKGVAEVLDFGAPLAKLLNLVEKEVGRGPFVRWSAPNLSEEPPKDVPQSRRFLTQQFEIEPDEEDVCSFDARGEEVANHLVNARR